MLAQDEDKDNVNNSEEVNHAILDDYDVYEYIAEYAGSSLFLMLKSKTRSRLHLRERLMRNLEGLLLQLLIVHNSD